MFGQMRSYTKERIRKFCLFEFVIAKERSDCGNLIHYYLHLYLCFSILQKTLNFNGSSDPLFSSFSLFIIKLKLFIQAIETY